MTPHLYVIWIAQYFLLLLLANDVSFLLVASFLILFVGSACYLFSPDFYTSAYNCYKKKWAYYDYTLTRKSKIWSTVLWLYPGIYEVRTYSDNILTLSWYLKRINGLVMATFVTDILMFLLLDIYYHILKPFTFSLHSRSRDIHRATCSSFDD